MSRPEWDRDTIGTSPESLEEPAATEEASVVRREEELRTGTTTDRVGSIRVRKEIDTYPIEKVLERHREEVNEIGERVPVTDRDSGEIETLEDGSVSIPVFEEEIVVTKRVVVRERLIVHKSTVTDEHRVEAELRRERVEVDADPGLEVAGDIDTSPSDVATERPIVGTDPGFEGAGDIDASPPPLGGAASSSEVES
jgi:uncharacterized protein (TIGR02271 family)